MCCPFDFRLHRYEPRDLDTALVEETAGTTFGEKLAFTVARRLVQFPLAALDGPRSPSRWHHRQFHPLDGSGCPSGRRAVAAWIPPSTAATLSRTSYRATRPSASSRSSRFWTKRRSVSRSGNGGVSCCPASSPFSQASPSSSSAAYSNAYAVARRRTLVTASKRQQRRRPRRNTKQPWVVR